VPYNGNEDWTEAMASKLGLTEVERFRPWVVDQVPAGYVTTYGAPQADGGAGDSALEGAALASNFTFLTVKEAGHVSQSHTLSLCLCVCVCLSLCVSLCVCLSVCLCVFLCVSLCLSVCGCLVCGAWCVPGHLCCAVRV
jgi:hypothetical protein